MALRSSPVTLKGLRCSARAKKVYRTRAAPGYCKSTALQVQELQCRLECLEHERDVHRDRAGMLQRLVDSHLQARARRDPTVKLKSM